MVESNSKQVVANWVAQTENGVTDLRWAIDTRQFK